LFSAQVKYILHTPQLGELKIACPADVAAVHSRYDCFMLTIAVPAGNHPAAGSLDVFRRVLLR
jgi:hypothetical protein